MQGVQVEVAANPCRQVLAASLQAKGLQWTRRQGKDTGNCAKAICRRIDQVSKYVMWTLHVMLVGKGCKLCLGCIFGAGGALSGGHLLLSSLRHISPDGGKGITTEIDTMKQCYCYSSSMRPASHPDWTLNWCILFHLS